jgi:hypothetical protein
LANEKKQKPTMTPAVITEEKDNRRGTRQSILICGDSIQNFTGLKSNRRGLLAFGAKTKNFPISLTWLKHGGVVIHQ